MTITPLIAIAFTLFVSFLFSELAKHFHYPRVLGQVVGGVVLGLPWLHAIITEEALQNIQFLAQLGIIFLFVVIGVEVDFKSLKVEKQRALRIACFTILIPLLAGFFLGKVLGESNLTALVMGVCLALSSGTINAQIFLDMKVIHKPMAKVLLAAAILVDFFAILFLAFLIPYIEGNLQEVAKIPVKILGFVGLIWVLIKVMPFFVNHIEQDESRVSEVSLLTLFGLIVAVASAQLGLGEMIGAFFAGLILQWATHHECSAQCGKQNAMHQRHKKFFQKNVHTLKTITLSFIIPFLFISIGLKMDLAHIFTAPLIVFTIIGMGIASKLLGALVTKPLVDFNAAQTWIVAWGMNARGTMELVMADLALEYGLISNSIYTGLIMMVVVTILLFPFFLRRILRRHPYAMALR